ncbi:MAG: hypothetical protein U0637_09610 [Phycisphaerales bacterium]
MKHASLLRLRSSVCPPGWMLALVGAAFLWFGAVVLQGCQSYDNGTSRTRTTRTVDSPDQRTTTTTTKERKVEEYPR